MHSKVTRRQLAATLAGGAALLGQEKPAQTDELKGARDQFRANADQLAKFELSMSTEPAFQFKP